MYIVVVGLPRSDVINVEINLAFLISRFYSWPKSKDKHLNILRKKIAEIGERKGIFIIFKDLSVGKNYLKPEKATLNFILVVPSFLKQHVE